MRTPDDQVERYLKLFTFLPLSKIEKIMEVQNRDPSKRSAHHILAAEFVELIHGPLESKAVAEQHRELFGSRHSKDAPTPVVANPTGGPPEDYKSPFKSFYNRTAGNKYAPQTNFANISSPNISLPESLVYNQTFNKILWYSGLASSRNEGARLINNNGAHVGARPEGPLAGPGGEMPDELQFTPVKMWTADKTKLYVMEGGFLLLKVGKWKLKIIKVISDEEFQKQGLSCPGWDPEKGAPAAIKKE